MMIFKPRNPSTRKKENDRALRQSNNDRRRILGLSAELRNRIYDYAVVHKNALLVSINSRADLRPKVPLITHVSRRLRAEALPIYYGQNIFCFTDSMFSGNALALFLGQRGDMLKHVTSITVARYHDVHVGNLKRRMQLRFAAQRTGNNVVSVGGVRMGEIDARLYRDGKALRDAPICSCTVQGLEAGALDQSVDDAITMLGSRRHPSPSLNVSSQVNARAALQNPLMRLLVHFNGLAEAPKPEFGPDIVCEHCRRVKGILSRGTRMGTASLERSWHVKDKSSVEHHL